MLLKNYAFYYNFNEHFSHKNVSTLHLLSKIHNSEYNIFVDRFDILTEDCEYNLLSRCDSIEDIQSCKLLSFEECVRKRCDEIIDMAGYKKIYISYSGGVDSTCIVCSFLMNERLNKDNFFVICNPFAIREYELFYRLLIEQGVNIIAIDESIESLINLTKDDVIFVNGNCGDQIDGSNILSKRFASVEYFLPWKDALIKAADLRHLRVSDKNISDVEEYIKLFGFEPEYAGDLSWFLGFAIKYNYAASYMKQLSYRPDNVVVFFDTIYFNKYGLVSYRMNREYKSQMSSFHYKLEWKKLIFSYTKDYDYFLHKGKEAPWIGTDFKANPGISWSDEYGYHRIKNPTKRDIYFTLVRYIKPEFREYYSLKEYEVIDNKCNLFVEI